MELDKKVTFLRDRIVTNLNCIAKDAGSKRKLSEMIGVTEQQFQRYTNQGGDIKLMLALKICNDLGLNISWLATGEGEKFGNLVDIENAENPMGSTPTTEGTPIDGISVRIIGAISKSGGAEKVAKKIGISSMQLKRYTKKDMDIKVITLLSIAEIAGLSFKWLATGKGNPQRRVVKNKTTKVTQTITLDELRDSLEKGEEVWNKASTVANTPLPVALEDNIKGMIIDYQMEPMAVVKLLLTIKRTMVAKP
ncbi:MAG: hypothetical protein JKY50_20580 [Oleispira sp.]|nr:hypothetical protein [Oleispira sp.]